MKHKEPRSLQDILSNQPDSLFTRLAHQQSKNDTLLTRIRAVLAPQIAQHLVAVTYREEILVLVADSPAWANRLRFETEHIRKKLITDGGFSDAVDAENSVLVIKKIVTRTTADTII